MQANRKETETKSNSGFSIIELLLTLSIVAILGVVLSLNLVGRRSASELTLTAQSIAATLREAQSRAVMQASSSAWGVHFDNGSSPFYAIFSGATFSTSSQYSRTSLPVTLRFTTTTIAQNNTADVNFAQLTGAASGSSSIAVYILANPQSSSSISIDPTGAISY